jgi:hypothetical protein
MTLVEVQAQLVTLRAAEIRIATGGQVEETQLPDGSRVRYSAANITQLRALISKYEASEATLLGTLTANRPIVPYF